MIIDKIENITKYPQIPSYAVEFICGIDKDTKLGKYKLQGNDYVNVEEYTTKTLTDAKFENHHNFIDIQILLSGKERIYTNSAQNLTVSEPYSSDRDIEFFSENVSTSDFVTLDGTNFVMLFPNEAHAPQVSIDDNSQIVKKMVVKLHI